LRQEDKQVDGPDLEQAEERKRENELVEEKSDELHDLDGQRERTLDKEASSAVLAAMKSILAGEQIVLNDLELDKRHQIALEALKTAVEGKDQQLARFVYAEDRRTLLEQALAVLQPELTSLDHFSAEFEELLKNVGTLREKLDVLEDSEEELVEGRFSDTAKAETDSDDKPDEDDGNDKKNRKKGEDDDTSLTGPPRKLPAKPVTTLGDPDEIYAERRKP
jgi:hypothetical protein